jgi:hypothetical protein
MLIMVTGVKRKAELMPSCKQSAGETRKLRASFLLPPHGNGVCSQAGGSPLRDISLIFGKRGQSLGI